ncbi:MAG TPA: 4-(cytidine 5'-diphospho)-2-C-methyl-D-erythritol kinase [Bryobacteraceae bacterium]|nr:4-(cytidine 5'-diphospho)-2-C-methyl-D-erythritol kinase [Bryobacteraceae bacterium]
MAAHVRLRSFAKINLDLRVLHKRADGYHELRTVFQTISLADTIEIDYTPGRTKIELISNVEIPGNLILKACDLVLRATRAKGQFRIRLRKRIPMGGGLGGGSSNAAAMILALPVLLKRPLNVEKMLEIASELGSDVPFFLMGGTAVGLGRGTELYPLPDTPASPGLLITPEVHSSTAMAYAALKRKPSDEPAPGTLREFQAFVQCATSPVANRQSPPRNDFETVVFRQHPQLKSLKGKLLKLGVRQALMTGSGSALFGLFPSRALRDQAARWLRRELPANQVYPFSMVSRGRYRSIWYRQLAVSSESMTWPPQDRYAR